jgi:hypothetical protein
MLAEEKHLVDEVFLGRDDVYNLAIGGKGSWFYDAKYPDVVKRENDAEIVAASKL